jgi:hypothetical protein
VQVGAIDSIDRTYFLPLNQPERIASQKNLNSKHCQGDRRKHHNSDYYSKSQRQLVQSNGGREFEHRCVRSSW